MPERIVITGVGAVTPMGLGAPRFWKGLAAGENAIRTLPDRPSDFPVSVAGIVSDFTPETLFERRTARRTGRYGLFGLLAAREAMAQSGLDAAADPERIGVVIGTAGGMLWPHGQERILEESGAKRVDPLHLSKHGPYMAAVRIAMELGVHGPTSTVNSACASGLDAIGQAVLLLRGGHADAILAGGTESLVSGLGLAVLSQLGALTRTTDPETASRPFDAERNGFVLSEGAGILVLERESYARARGAHLLGEVAGVGWSFDASDETAPDVYGQSLAMSRAIQDADTTAANIDWVKAHGTSTVLNDKTETAAIRLALGAANAEGIPVSSVKSMIGHTASASGGVEAVAAVLAMTAGVLPPTIHYEHPDAACDLDYVPNRARIQPIRQVLVNAFGLGGQNACLVLRSAF